MKKIFAVTIPIIPILILWNGTALSIETAPHISDREIVERLTRLEEGQNAIRTEVRTNADAIKQLREDMNKQFERVDARFEQMDKQFDSRFEQMNKQFDNRFEQINKQLSGIDKQFDRVDTQFDRIDKQFDRLVNIMLGIFGAFAAMCGGTIWFALWDRRTMIRPFEDKVKRIEDDISENRTRLHTLLDAFKALGKTDEKVANILRKFNLL